MIKTVSLAGVTLIEVLVSISIITVLLGVIGYSVNSYVSAREVLLESTKAAYLAEEGLEIVRSIRDTDWNTIEALSLNTRLYLEVSTTTVAIDTSPEIINGEFERFFIVQEVHRNASDDIVSPPTGTSVVDPGSKQIDMYVVGPSGTTTLSSIITNLYAI
jgi:type II secretory pathway pseudopilin PulG